MSTPNMNLDLPVPGTSTDWAAKLNTALTVVDAHDHTPGNGAGLSANAIANIAALRGLSVAPAAGALFQTRGYATDGDGGQAFYRWDATSTDADDGALVIKATALTTGRFRYVDTLGGVFRIQSSPVPIDPGVTPSSVAWTTLLTSLMAAGYHALDQTGARILFADGDTFIPKRAAWTGFDIIGGTYDGTGHQNGPFGPFIRVSTGVESTGLAYTSRTWTGAVTQGQTTFNGVANIVGLSLGDTVFIRLGADPTNDGGPDIFYDAKIVTITPTTGTAGNVTVSVGVPQMPLNPLPSWNLNTFRTTGTQHDMVKVTGFQDNIRFIRPTLKAVSFLCEQTRRTDFIDPLCVSGSFFWRFDTCQDLRVLEPVVEELTAYTGGGGYSAYYGFIFTNYASRSIEVRNLHAKSIKAAGGVWDEEEPGNGIHFTGITRCNWNNAAVGAPTSAFVAGARLQQTIVVDHLIAEGGPNSAINGGNVWIGQLEALGGIGVIGQDLARVGNLRLSDLNNTTVEWNERRPYRGLVAPIVVNATTDFEIPVHGMLRSLRVFASTLTGVTSVSLVREDTATQDITASLVAGGWAQIARFVTDMGNSFGTYNRLNSGAYNGSKVVIRVVTTGSFAAGGYLFVDAEMLTASASLYTTSGNPTYTDTSRPLEIAGSGAPSLNAAFVGQKYLNVANGQRYTAKAVGSGAGDWA